LGLKINTFMDQVFLSKTVEFQLNRLHKYTCWTSDRNYPLPFFFARPLGGGWAPSSTSVDSTSRRQTNSWTVNLRTNKLQPLTAQQRHRHAYATTVIGKESVPKIRINDTINFFLKLQSAFWKFHFKPCTVSKCCLIKLLPHILF